LLVVGFLVPAASNVLATGVVKPHQLRPATPNAPPVLQAIGPRASGDAPLEFEVAENELLELPIHATDPEGDPLTFSVVGVPVGSRPVYQFWSISIGSHFWTAQENDKRLLLSAYFRSVWDCEGIAFYAYVRADAQAGLHPVHRFWSPGQLRHLYTMDEREKQTLLQQSPAGTWEYEGIVFYAFGEDSHPADTAAVYRFPGQERGDSWEVGHGTLGVGDRESKTNDGDTRTGRAVWYVPLASEPPVGAGIRDGVFRWRTTSGQRGQYQLNIIVDDGGLQSCQLVKIQVLAPISKIPNSKRSGADDSVSAIPAQAGIGFVSDFSRAGLELLPEAVDRAFDAVTENFMVVFFVPWLLGLYWRLRYQAERLERVLTVAVVVVNLALILGRHTVFGLGDDRRYSMGMIALTIFYVPVGIEVIVQGLDLLHLLPRPRWASPALRHSIWFHLLIVMGIVVCLPKLVLPSPGNKVGYLAAAEWLQQNTDANDVVAVPDIRISFYGQRRGLVYGQYPNSRRADYIVMIDDNGAIQIPTQWHREYSVLVDRRSKKTLAIYNTARPKR
jgi:hypothetical protein